MRNAVEIGLIAALTLGVLGGSRELILADYLKSNEALDHNMAVIDLMHEHNGTTSVLTKEERRISNLVTADVMNATLDWLEGRGGITACKCRCNPLRLLRKPQRNCLQIWRALASARRMCRGWPRCCW